MPVRGLAVPEKAVLEMVSFYDRKRYRIIVNLPDDLALRMKKEYEVDGRTDQRTWLYFGLAPGGYYEVLLKADRLSVKPDLLISRGIAEEVMDDWYDKKVSIAEQYKTHSFDVEYQTLFSQHPIPKGLEWSEIMDAYRAKQPKTDQHPIK